jgi:hypothetical protein
MFPREFLFAALLLTKTEKPFSLKDCANKYYEVVLLVLIVVHKTLASSIIQNRIVSIMMSI